MRWIFRSIRLLLASYCRLTGLPVDQKMVGKKERIFSIQPRVVAHNNTNPETQKKEKFFCLSSNFKPNTGGSFENVPVIPIINSERSVWFYLGVGIFFLVNLLSMCNANITEKHRILQKRYKQIHSHTIRHPWHTNRLTWQIKILWKLPSTEHSSLFGANIVCLLWLFVGLMLLDIKHRLVVIIVGNEHDVLQQITQSITNI